MKNRRPSDRVISASDELADGQRVASAIDPLGRSMAALALLANGRWHVQDHTLVESPPVRLRVPSDHPDTVRMLFVALPGAPQVLEPGFERLDEYERAGIAWTELAERLTVMEREGVPAEQFLRDARETTVEGKERFLASIYEVRLASLCPELLQIGPDWPEQPESYTEHPSLQKAREAGRDDRFVEAAELYSQVIVDSLQNGDIEGETRATIGLSMTYDELGQYEASEDVLLQLLLRRPLPRRMADYVARSQVLASLEQGQVARARAWLQKCPPGSVDREIPVLLAEGRACEALHAVGRVDRGRLRAVQLQALSQREAAAHLAATGGSASRAAELIGQTKQLAPKEYRLDWLLLSAQLDSRQGHNHWRQTCRRLWRTWSARPGLPQPRHQEHPAIALALQAYQDGEHNAANTILSIIRPAPARCLVLVETAPGEFFGRNAQGQLLRLKADPLGLHETIEVARIEVQRGGPGPAVEWLRSWLPLSPAPLSVFLPPSLDGIPWPAVEPSVSTEFRGAPTRPVLRKDEQDAIASVADVSGGLPFAAREITEEQAILFGRGHAASYELLRKVPRSVGLVHLAVHGRRTPAGPVLVFADQDANAVSLGRLSLPPGCVVLAAACGTGLAPRVRSVQSGIVDGLLQAGAGQVVATRWPVNDERMSIAVVDLVRRWPWVSTGQAVTETVNALRRAGQPSGIWGTLSVYTRPALPILPP